MGLVNELLRVLKGTTAVERGVKAKLQELANRARVVAGSEDYVGRMEQVIEENSLQGMIQECMQTKVKNMHQRELLALERDFHGNVERIRGEVRGEVEAEFRRELESTEERARDKEDEVEELRQIKGQLKEEIEKREDTIGQLMKKVEELTEANQ